MNRGGGLEHELSATYNADSFPEHHSHFVLGGLIGQIVG